MTHSPKSRTVLFDHDGGVDDLLSLMMLLAMSHIELAGIVVTPADCFLRPAVSASLKILRFFDRLHIELSEGTLHGVNSFPRAWRAHAYAIDALPILNEIKTTETDRLSVDYDAQPDRLTGRLKSPSELGGLEKQIQPAPGEDFEALKQRLQHRLITALDPAMHGSRVDDIQRTLRSLFERVLAQENIILSRTERERLFKTLTTDVLANLGGVLPAPVAEPGHEFLARKLREASHPLTILITGPVSNLAVALESEPELASNIEEVVWMGGALGVPGNVRDYEHDGSAEWNAYWDPPATHSLWQSEAPITLFSLDTTNHVRVKMDFLFRLAQQRRYLVSDLAGQCWALTVGTISSDDYTYFMWDTLTTGYLGAPQHITFRQARTQVMSQGPSAGRIKEVTTGGKLVRVAETVDIAGFQAYLLGLFRR